MAIQATKNRIAEKSKIPAVGHVMHLSGITTDGLMNTKRHIHARAYVFDVNKKHNKII